LFELLFYSAISTDSADSPSMPHAEFLPIKAWG
jgi:hypothetical protein